MLDVRSIVSLWPLLRIHPRRSRHIVPYILVDPSHTMATKAARLGEE